MEIGGAETSLIGLLSSIDYNEYNVDLMLFSPIGELMPLIPEQVNLVPAPEKYKYLYTPIATAVKKGHFLIASFRMLSKIKVKTTSYDKSYMIKHYSHKCSVRFLPKLNKHYDLAISFIDPHFIVNKNVDADVKLGWLHTDITSMNLDIKSDEQMWNECDYCVTVSQNCKNAFDKNYPSLKDKSIVIENILPKSFVQMRSNAFTVENEIDKNCISICSVGRYTVAKNFDNVPHICKLIREKGYNVKWYILGYGTDEKIIKDKIKESAMEDYVVLLGKKDNPYPYIKACNIYIQPSRFEGKSVAVREAQMLDKPVIITNFKTSASQLTDGFDGVIVPMDNEGCANGICKVLEDSELQKKLSNNCANSDYSNCSEINKIYNLIK